MHNVADALPSLRILTGDGRRGQDGATRLYEETVRWTRDGSVRSLYHRWQTPLLLKYGLVVSAEAFAYVHLRSAGPAVHKTFTTRSQHDHSTLTIRSQYVYDKLTTG